MYKAKIIPILLAMVAAPAFADPSWRNTPITFILVQDGGTAGHQGIVIIEFPTNSMYLPGCHTSTLRNRVIIDLSRAPAKAQLSLLLANNLAGQNVNIDVNETCLEGLALVRNVFNAS
jgi:hypothetical protein